MSDLNESPTKAGDRAGIMAAREARIRSTRIAVDSCNTFLISSIRQTQKLRIPNLGFCIAKKSHGNNN